MELDERVVSGRRRQPSFGVVGQFRRRGLHDGEHGHRRERRILHEKAIYMLEGQLLRWSGWISTAGRRICARSIASIYRRDGVYEGDDS